MSETAGENTNPAIPTPPVGSVLHNALELFKKADTDDLSKIRALLEKEIDRRVADLEQKLEHMRKALDRPKARMVASDSNSSASKQSSKQGGRAPRGRAKELILTFLQDGPKDRKQINVHFDANGVSKASISTLLNRLKKDKSIEYDENSKRYSLPSKSSG